MAHSAEKISDDAVYKATSKKWDDWFTFLNKSGAKDLDHKEIVSLIRAEDITHWWAQMITVEYERYSGRRTLGQTADTGFQLGVSKTFSVPQSVVWDTIFSKQGLAVWLGKDADFKIEKGYKYTTSDGISGEIRTIDQPNKLRFTWQKNDDKETTLQIYLFPSGSDKTSLRFHQEKLKNAQQRQELKKYWQDKLKKLEQLLV